jgi:hypothetical protein
MCEVIPRVLKTKPKKETTLTFFEVVVVRVILYGSETWMSKRNCTIMQAV